MGSKLHLRAGEVVIDVLVVVALVAGVAVVKFGLQPTQNGYSCDDTTIALKFYPSTVKSTIAYIVGTVIVLLAIILTELHNTTTTTNSEGRALTPKERAAYVSIHVYRFLGFYAFGVWVTTIITDLAKVMVGRLRPNFLDVCQPVESQRNACLNSGLNYISTVECTGDPYDIQQSRLSFPSGHSSFVFFAAVYGMLYLQARCRWRPCGAVLVVPLVQLLMVLLALAVALSRISDHKHHWTDVLAGSVLGALVALLVCAYTGRFFTARWRAPRNSIQSPDALPMTEGEFRNGDKRNVV